MPRSRRHSLGFAALEMIMAVIILGIVFAMTLKGRDLVNAARAFVTANQIRDFQNQFALYADRYRAKPGDDPAAPKRWGRANSVYIIFGAPVSFTGDLRIQGMLSDYGNANGEQFNAWRDLRFAGILDGDRDLVGQSAMPENLFGGAFGLADENLGLKDVICVTQIPGLAAEQIDRRLDDGRIDTGSVRATSRWDPIEAKNAFPAPDTGAYHPDKTYLICTPQVL